MEVTRNVVLDLLPLYHSGEASADTRAVVEEYLRREPALRRLIDTDETAPPPPADDAERAALEQTRKHLRRRSWTMAVALLCTLLPFTMAFLDNRLTFLMFRDVPWSRALWVVAAVLWVSYARHQRAARVAGL